MATVTHNQLIERATYGAPSRASSFRSSPTLERMFTLIRIAAIVLGLALASGPVLLALVVAGVEPSRPVQFSWVAPFAIGGLAAGAGCLAVAAFARSIASAPPHLRLLVGFLVVVPALLAVYLLAATGVLVMVGLSLAVLACTALVALMGKVAREWQSAEYVLALFDTNQPSARKQNRKYVEKGIALGKRGDEYR